MTRPARGVIAAREARHPDGGLERDGTGPHVALPARAKGQLRARPQEGSGSAPAARLSVTSSEGDH